MNKHPGRKQTPAVAAALSYLRDNPNAKQAWVAAQYSINRVTLSKALARERTACYACGHPLTPKLSANFVAR